MFLGPHATGFLAKKIALVVYHRQKIACFEKFEDTNMSLRTLSLNFHTASYHHELTNQNMKYLLDISKFFMHQSYVIDLDSNSNSLSP